MNAEWSAAELLAGVDEVGRGPLAGPVVACALILPQGLIIDGVKDSKKLSAAKREKLSKVIIKNAICYAIAQADEQTIDRINILQATLLAMKRAVQALSPVPQALIVDGTFAPDVGREIAVTCLPRADALCHTVSAASIVAKVYRDALMDKLHEQYPQYGFNRHKGYGTAEHLKAIKEFGACPIHRKTFKPIKE